MRFSRLHTTPRLSLLDQEPGDEPVGGVPDAPTTEPPVEPGDATPPSEDPVEPPPVDEPATEPAPAQPSLREALSARGFDLNELFGYEPQSEDELLGVVESRLRLMRELEPRLKQIDEQRRHRFQSPPPPVDEKVPYWKRPLDPVANRFIRQNPETGAYEPLHPQYAEHADQANQMLVERERFGHQFLENPEETVWTLIEKRLDDMLSERTTPLSEMTREREAAQLSEAVAPYADLFQDASGQRTAEYLRFADAFDQASELRGPDGRSLTPQQRVAYAAAVSGLQPAQVASPSQHQSPPQAIAPSPQMPPTPTPNPADTNRQHKANAIAQGLASDSQREMGAPVVSKKANYHSLTNDFQQRIRESAS